MWKLQNIVDDLYDKALEAQQAQTEVHGLVGGLEDFPATLNTSDSLMNIIQTADDHALDFEALGDELSQLRAHLEVLQYDVGTVTEAFPPGSATTRGVSQHNPAAAIAQMARRRTANRVRMKTPVRSPSRTPTFSTTGGQHPAMYLKSPKKLKQRVKTLESQLTRTKLSPAIKNRKLDELAALQGLLRSKEYDTRH